jgi:hypothetical protein
MLALELCHGNDSTLSDGASICGTCKTRGNDRQRSRVVDTADRFSERHDEGLYGVQCCMGTVT